MSLTVSVVIAVLVLLTVPDRGDGRDSPSGRTVSASKRAELEGRLDMQRIERKIHELVNLERKKKGLSALAWNADLNRIARGFSGDMASRRFFAHTDPEGKGFCDRYRAAGFDCRLRMGNTVCLGAENIAQENTWRGVTYRNGIASYDWNTEDDIAVSVVRMWMGSAGHRENILTPYFKRQGIGVAVSEDGKVFVTENFC